MSRGVYRGVYSSLPDDVDFQRLSPEARLVLYTCRLCSQAGPAAIFRYYPEILGRQTGLKPKQIESALTELERETWIVREYPVLWVRNGLRHDPHMRLSNVKHRKSIETSLRSLPRLHIVASFCDYYGLPLPFDRHAVVGQQEKEKEYEVLQEIKQEKEKEPAGAAIADLPPLLLERIPGLKSWPSVEALVAWWNDTATRDGLPVVETISDARREKARRYLRQFPEWRFWNGALSRIKLSPFLTGKVPPKNGHTKAFRADFDWLLATKDGVENVAKLFDGKYDG